LHIEKVKKIYDFYSDFYDFVFAWILSPNLKYAMSLHQFKEGQHILEVGIGTGISLKNYPPFCKITGVDISSGMLKKAEERARKLKLKNIELKVMDGTKLEFPDRSFDYVIAAFVVSVCHQPEKMLDEMIRVLKDNGRIIIVNHFASEIMPINAIEKLMNPLTERLGWRMDLSLRDLLKRNDIILEKKKKILPFSPWTVVILRKDLKNVKG
jgi:phosphatidylethanolamine/phosphatidyl-N-methylethanolamine N-methyltransferase